MNTCILYDSLKEEFFGLEQSLADGLITESYFWKDDQSYAFVFYSTKQCVEIVARHYQDIENPKVDSWYIVSWDDGADFGNAFPFSERVEEYYYG